jgi:hypothetical protein
MCSRNFGVISYHIYFEIGQLIKTLESGRYGDLINMFCSVIDEKELKEVKTKLMGCSNFKEPPNSQVYRENANFPPQCNWIRFRTSKEHPLELR